MPAANVHLKDRAIRAVILDYGEVLSFPPAPETISAMAAVFHISGGEFRELYYAERYAYDRGEISGEEYWKAIAKDAGTQLSAEQIDWLRRVDIQMWSKVNPAMLRWAAQLRNEGVKTAVLSNMHADMVRDVRESVTWMRDFDCTVLSAELGLAKPDPLIFEYCLNCLNLPAREAVFIDDKPQNTRAAEDQGMAGVCGNSVETIREQLQNTGWSGPLP